MNQKSLLTLVTCGHIFLLLMLSINFKFFNQEIGLGEQISINSYLLTDEWNLENTIQHPIIQQTKEIIKSQKHGIFEKKLPHTIRRATSNEKHQVSSALHKEGNGKSITELVARLHQVIQAHQQYPESALQMERSGGATVSFRLFPNGLIENLRLVKTSGTSSLDEAALEAVRASVPFKDVDQFLKQAEEYQITVAFELTSI